MTSRIAALFLIFFLASVASLAQAPTAPAKTLSGDQIIERAAPSVVLILVGNGSGQLAAVGSGLIIRSDGVILTAHHVVRGMKEVQVRLKSGEVYDRAEFIAADERRDIAALRIHATGLPVLPVAPSAALQSGATVYLVSHGAGLPWSASSGILSAARMADEVPGAGSGYRVLQYTAATAPGSSGGVLVDSRAQALGIAVGSLTGGQNLNFAVPVDSVAGLATASGGTAFASGASLRLPTAPLPDQPQTVAGGRPRTLTVVSKTIYIRRERLQDDLRANPLFGQLGLRFADYAQHADLGITVDRPAGTFDWTYVIVHQPSGAVLANGMVEGEDEFQVGPLLASVILQAIGSGAAQPAPAASLVSVPVAPATHVLRNFRTLFVESHTIYLKGNQLQDALYVRPEFRDWGIRIVDDRSAADVYVNVTRPFLTFDWNYEIIDLKGNAVIAKGKVIAWDGPIAAPQLAAEIVKQIRAARPLPAGAEKK